MTAVPHVAKSARKFHFISGMPRSGSTLLAAILNQNPRFRSGMTSPLADIMGVVMAETSSKNDFSFDVSDEQRVAVLRGLVENFYAGQADAGVVFDTQPAVVQPDAVAGNAVSGGEGHCVRSPVVLGVGQHGTAGTQATGRRQQGVPVRHKTTVTR